MRKAINLFSRVLVALVLCVGLIMTGCTEGPLDKNENTEQGGSENQGDNGNEDGEGEKPGQGGNDNQGEQDDPAEEEKQSVSRGPITLVLENVTATTVTFAAQLDVDMMADYQEVGLIYSIENDLDLENEDAVSVKINREEYSETFTELPYNTKYYYTVYLIRNGVYAYGEVKEFTTVNVVPSVSVDESSITATTASFIGVVSGLSDVDRFLVDNSEIEIGMEYSSVRDDLQSDKSTKVASGKISEDWTYSMSMSMKQDFYDAIKYYYCSYVLHNGVYTYGEVKEFSTKGAVVDLNMSSATDLSSSESANCYIISQSGTYKFKTVKGNSSTSVGNVASCTILWESFGTSTTPDYCSLISGICYKDNYIAFETSSTFTKGNAVIAAKDASGKILWSWHIWLTDQPQSHVYNNNAGTMMDRNLGATSATPGDVGALGLLYQWGRKDPFLGSSSISSSRVAKSTLSWPSAVESTSSTGTIDYVTANPTTYVYGVSSSNYDWHYVSRDNTLWQSSKTIYDPCPSGWRVPDGRNSGVWSTALGSSSPFDYSYDSTNEGMNFSGKFGTASTIWYPALGCRSCIGGVLINVGYSGDYWSVTPFSVSACLLYFHNDGNVGPSSSSSRAFGYAVRCLQVID